MIIVYGIWLTSALDGAEMFKMNRNRKKLIEIGPHITGRVRGRINDPKMSFDIQFTFKIAYQKHQYEGVSEYLKR